MRLVARTLLMVTGSGCVADGSRAGLGRRGEGDFHAGVEPFQLADLVALISQAISVMVRATATMAFCLPRRRA